MNELNLEGSNIFNLTWDQRIEMGQVFAAGIKAGNPNARILTGSLALAYDTPDSRSFPELLCAGVPADMIGIELYQAGVNTVLSQICLAPPRCMIDGNSFGWAAGDDRVQG
jgi:hypothetical protein